MRRDYICCICGSKKKNPFIPTCNTCSPYLYKKGTYPHQKVRRRKIWETKRQEKLEQVGYQCEWCERDDQPLSIHHPEEINSRTYEYIWYKILDKKIDEFLQEDPVRKDIANDYIKYINKKILQEKIKAHQDKATTQIDGCPICGSTHYISLEDTIFRYKCKSCRFKFKELLKRPDFFHKENVRSRSSLVIKNLIKNRLRTKILPLIYEGLKEEYEYQVEYILKQYLNFSNTVILCRSCHGAIRKGLVICKLCKKHYHSDDYDQCYKCFQKQVEEFKPTMKLIEEIFNISPEEYGLMEFEPFCLKCGRDIFNEVEDYHVYLNKDDLKKNKCIGVFCENCYQKYLLIKESRYIVKKIQG